MKIFLQEYGQMIVSIIVAIMFFGVMQYLMREENGITFVYRTHSLYQEYNDELGTSVAGSLDSPLDAINGVQNTNAKEKSPYFRVANSINDTLRISDYAPCDGDGKLTEFDAKWNTYKINGYESIVNKFTDNGNIKAYTGEGSEVPANNLELVIVTYEPEMEYAYGIGVAKKKFVTEFVDALDKFGNRIWNSDTNSFLQTEQLKYNQTKWHRHNSECTSECQYKDISNFEVNMRVPCKIKVIYRYQQGALKCEYMKLFKNEVIDAYSGLLIDGEIKP